MQLACLFGKHRWEPLQRTGDLRLEPQQCRHCARTRIWNARDRTWMHGPAEGLPEDLVAFIADANGDSGLASAPDTELPISRKLAFYSGGGGFVIAGPVVAAMGLPVWLAAPTLAPKLAIGVPLLALGYVLAAGRREVRVNRESGTLVHRVRVIPFTLFRRTYRPERLDTVRVAWEPRAWVLGPRWGPRPNFLVRALGPGVNVMITNCLEPKSARNAGRSVSRALDLSLDDRTREPGAPGT
jgi:hypothetical protein